MAGSLFGFFPHTAHKNHKKISYHRYQYSLIAMLIPESTNRKMTTFYKKKTSTKY